MLINLFTNFFGVLNANNKSLKLLAPWKQLKSNTKDWDSASAEKLGAMLICGHLIREFEKTTLNLASKGLVHGPAHSSIGQEGGAIGSISSLKMGDMVSGSHRGHHQFIAKSLYHSVSEWELLDPRCRMLSTIF